jgi:predicted anti-sigma-YlaC factor YlaD
MDCQAVRHAMLEALDDAHDATRSSGIDAHVAECAECQAFSRRLQLVDARLSRAFEPPEPRPALRAGVLRQIGREKRAAWLESLPDVLHFAGCAAATGISVAVVPVAALTTLAVGTTVSLFAYVAMCSLRSSLRESE